MTTRIKAATRGVLLLMAVLCLGLLSSDSRAQSGTFATQLSLNDSEDVYNMAPYLYITRDPGKNVTYTGVVERHLGGKRGEIIKSKVLALGSTGTPHWIIATVNNQSQHDRWVLDFGQHLDGRNGLIDKIFIYDHTARKRVIDTVSVNPVPGARREVLSGTTVQMNIPSGSTATLVMYIVPRGGMPLTLGFNLMTQEHYLQRSDDPFTGSHTAYLLFAIVIGFHFAVMVLMRAWGNAAIIVYFAAQMMLFSWNNNQVYSPYLQTQLISAILATISLFAGFIINKVFFRITRYDGTPFKLMIIIPVIIAILVTLSLALPGDNIMRYLVFSAALLGGYLFLSLMSVAQLFQGKTGALYIACGWVTVLAGMLITTVASFNVMAPTPMTVAMCWYALIPQAILISYAVLRFFLMQDVLERQEEEEENQEADQVVKISQIRESQELNRLKRLVEHERQVMQELRDREIEQNEEMRQARVSADEANRAKSAFLAVVSHEIRTPMTGIMGMVRLLLDTALSPSQKDYAQTIQDSGDAMMSLLNDILDFEKIESGKMDLERIDFDLHRLANSIITLMSGHATNKGIYLKLNMDPKLPRYVIGDPVRLRQVLLNLVGNSIKFTSEGGVTLELMPEPNSEGLARGSVHKIRYAVRDTGVGISKEAQHNLFRPFAQADSSVSRKFGGTGLGLAISQRLIEAMGNRISIDSEEGRGSTFYFTLIMEEGQSINVENSESRDSLSSKSSRSLRVLVVEDNEINQKLLKEFIGRMGHEVLQAMSGEEGIEAVKKERPDIILMDVELPGISGMGATKAIRALPDDELARIPVIALTGNTREEDIRTCYAANMNGHIAKPVDPLRLRQMIDKAINNKLDNPVEVAADRGEAYTQTTQLGETTVRPAERVVVSPKPATSAPSAQAAILRHVMQEDPEAFFDEEPLKQKPAAEPERPLISDFAKEEPLGLQLADDELDEDSFAEAVNAAEDQASRNENGAAVFDRAMLDPLKGGMKPDQLQELIDGLLDKAEEIVLALDVAVNTQDRATVTARAHELKGMAGNFGLTELSKAAEVLERTAKNDDAADLGPIVKNIPGAYKRARVAINEWMGQ